MMFIILVPLGSACSYPREGTLAEVVFPLFLSLSSFFRLHNSNQANEKSAIKQTLHSDVLISFVRNGHHIPEEHVEVGYHQTIIPTVMIKKSN
jgi:hypothetical protein